MIKSSTHPESPGQQAPSGCRYGRSQEEEESATPLHLNPQPRSPQADQLSIFGAGTDKMWAVWRQVLTSLEEREQPVVCDLWQEEEGVNKQRNKPSVRTELLR